jgi:thiol-disulfide isomerase/thioredoxin
VRPSLPLIVLAGAAVLLCAATPKGPDAASGPADCLGIEGPDRSECLRSAAIPVPPDRRTLDALRELVASDAGEVERLVGQAEAVLPSVGTPRSPSQTADLLEIRAEALSRLGRHADAVSTARAAVKLDDGASRLSWLAPETTLWSSTIDPGDGRLARAARILVEAGETREAREWLGRAMAAGAGAEALAAWERTGGGPTPPLDAETKPLVAEEWFPLLPELSVRLHDGGEFNLASARGKVLLVNFWASWCAPCIRELPALQDMAKRHRDAGLVVLTINARETRNTAESTFRNLGVELPLGVYDDALDRAFSVRTLPTTVLADRQGRIRARWDSRVPDVEAEIQKRVTGLLSGAGDDAGRTLAQVTQGGGTFSARWTRELPGPIGGIVFLPRGGTDAVAVTAGDQLTYLDATGKVSRRVKLKGPPSGRLLALDSADGKAPGLLSFRPGRDELLRIDPAGSDPRIWKTESPVLDAAVLPSVGPRARVVVATASGAGILDAEGALTRWSEAPADSCAVAALQGGRVAAASRGARVVWLGPDGAADGTSDIGADSCGPLLVQPGSAAVGVTPSTVRAGAVGRFLAPGAWHAALATGDDQLVVVSLATGAMVFRARWSGIGALGAGDLDGDGLDELSVADGRRITLLGRKRP